jgi:hypothetical protein
MPFYDEPNINNEIKNQRIGCCLLFRSSSELIQIGLNVKNLTANNGALIIAGFSEVTVDNCKVKGGSHIACIAIINGSKEPLCGDILLMILVIMNMAGGGKLS